MHGAALMVAWALAGFIVLASLGPPGWRPHLGDPQLERFGAYFLTGIAFALAYPRHPFAVAAVVAAAAIGLEFGQLVAPGRDAGVDDALAKVLGGLAGVTAGQVCQVIWNRLLTRGPD